MHLAIDWGTSYTKIGYLKAGQAVNLAGEQAVIPTVAAYDPSVGLIFGPGALRVQQETATVQQFKLELKRNPDFYLGPYDLETLLLRYFDFLNRQYVAPAGETIDSLTVGVPNYFGLNARRLLLKALHQCFAATRIELLPEPVAAVIGCNTHQADPLQGDVLSLDIGGGTCDFSFLSLSGVNGCTLESQLQTGHDAFSGSEIDRAIVNNILWPEFLIQTGYSPARFPLDRSPRNLYRYNRLLLAAQRIKLDLSQNQEVYIHLPDFYDSVSLQMQLDLKTFLERTRKVYDTLADFINTSVKSRASGLGLLNNNEWDLDSLLLVGGASRTPGVTEFLTRIFPRVPLVLPQDREFNVLKGLMVWVDNQEYSCQVKTMYPFNFYVERFDAAAQTAILEKIPFDLNNLRLEINKKYRIITFDRDTLYNLSPDPEFLNIRIYEGDAETPQLADQFSGRDLVLEVAAPRSALPDQISVYLDLSQGKLEISDGYKTAQSISKSNHWGRLNQRQWDCYDHLSKNNPNSLLMQDYRSQLQMLKEPKAQACSGYDRLTLYKIYALLDAVQKRK